MIAGCRIAVAVVTGAARGMGAAIFSALVLRGGHEVIGVDVNRETLESTGADFGARGLPFRAKPGDVSAADRVERLFGEIASEFGGVDVLVNNAGTCFMTELVDTTPEEFRQQMAINFDRAFYCCQRVIPLMLGRPGMKNIVNISSNGA